MTEEDNFDRSSSSQCRQRPRVLQACQCYTAGGKNPHLFPPCIYTKLIHVTQTMAEKRVGATVTKGDMQGACFFVWASVGRLALLEGCLLAKSHHESFPSSPAELLAALKCCYAQVQPH